MRRAALLALLPLAAAACHRAAGSAILPAPPGFITTDRHDLRDDQGRLRVFRGVNARVAGVFDVTFADGRTAVEPIPDFTAADAQRMAEMGFDALRLPVSWSGLEPASGSFDDAYLDRVAAVVTTASAAGLYVMLDLHQDAYSKEIGEDGAPLWAIVPPPTQLLQGPLTDLSARRNSAQVLAAFDTLFNDTSAGATLRASFAGAAAHLAARFAGSPAVIGYELFNEPTQEKSVATLTAFYVEAAGAIRAVDPYHLVFFEPDVSRDVTDTAYRSPAPFPDPRAVYAPHVYTDAFTGVDLTTVTIDALRPSMAAARKEADSWRAPLWIGEWGASPAAAGVEAYLGDELALQDEELASGTLWLWKEESQGDWGLYAVDPTSGVFTERPAIVGAVARPYASAIPGKDASMEYDAGTRRLTVHWTGAGAAELRVPAAPLYPSGWSVTCEGAPAAPMAVGLSGWEVRCPGGGVHVLVLSP